MIGKLYIQVQLEMGFLENLRKIVTSAICCTCKVQRLEEKSCLNFEKYVDNFTEKRWDKKQIQ